VRYFKDLWGWYWALSFPIKILVTALVSSLGGGTYVAFVAEFASYVYALNLGFRPPFEGIPYLRVAVIVLAAALSLSFAFYSILVSYVSKLIIQRSAISDYKKKLLVFVVSSILVVATITIGSIYFSRQDYPQLMAIIAAFLGGLLPIFENKIKSKTFSYVIIACIGLIILLAPLSLYNSWVYAKFLRVLGYGGGIPVDVAVVSGDKVIEFQGSLLLRTTDSVFVYNDEGEKQIDEIPLQQIIRIRTNPSVDAESFKLPQ